ncbi:MAG: DPP IV N-terminal domain-containing protein, partial [Vicinamibacteria bacterium]
LIENRDRVIEKNEFLATIWGKTFVSENVLSREIAQIRRMIGDDARNPKYVETVATRGYRFIADVAVGEPQARGAHRTALLAAAITGGLLIFAAFIWSSRTAHKVPVDLSERSARQVTTSTRLDMSPSFSPDGSTIAYSSDKNGTFEIYLRSLTPEGTEIQLTSDGQPNVRPAWSPDGQYIAYESLIEEGIRVVPVLGGVNRRVTDFGGCPAWSPDGSQIAFQSDGHPDINPFGHPASVPSTIWVVSRDGGDPKQLTRVGEPPGGHSSPAWSPDGNRIAFATFDTGVGGIWSISVAGDELEQLTNRKRSYEPAFSPDGKSIYFSAPSAPGDFCLWQISLLPKTGKAAGRAACVARFPLLRYSNISADGTQLAFSSMRMTSNLWSVPVSPSSGEPEGAPSQLTQSTSTRNGGARFSPDGQRIAYYEVPVGGTLNVRIIDAGGSDLNRRSFERVAAPGWFPEGDRLAIIKEGRLWELSIETGRKVPLREHGQGWSYTTLSPDGKRIAFHVLDGGARHVWSAPVDGGPARQLTFGEDSLGYSSWSPDSKTIVFQIRRGQDVQLALIPSEGGSPTLLTSGPGVSFGPMSWSPDGSKIPFAGWRNGYWNLWWVSRDGKTQRKVTDYSDPAAYVRYPAWSPMGDRIVYEYAETRGNIWVMDLN